MAKHPDVVIIGAGAAGLMCAIEAGKRGRNVLLLDHANQVGKKILMSGGGRCNFTNYHISPEKYISHNPHFCKSALSCYTQWDFIQLVKKHKIAFHEKTLGQLFCDNKAREITRMLLTECEATGKIKISLNTPVSAVQVVNSKADRKLNFKVFTGKEEILCQSLVIATGGLSIPTMGASPFAYKIAEQFGIKVWPVRAGLVPLTLDSREKEKFSALTGIAVDSLVSTEQQDISFRENILLTHRGLSGPAILQISSYWQPGEKIMINLLPEINNLFEELKYYLSHGKSAKLLGNVLSENFPLPRRLLETFFSTPLLNQKMAHVAHQELKKIAQTLQHWVIQPNGTEGYRTAEVTLGGVDCNALSSKTMQALAVTGLYFIGEAVDVSGWLGGYNFQWAWSSGFAAGQAV